MGVCYLLHFDQAYKHARHYLGWSQDLGERLQSHRNGQGARLLAVINNAGITWQLVRIWEGDRHFERYLKNKKNTPKLCPLCQGTPIDDTLAKEHHHV